MCRRSIAAVQFSTLVGARLGVVGLLVLALTGCSEPDIILPPAQPPDAPLCVPEVVDFMSNLAVPPSGGEPADMPGQVVAHADFDEDGARDLVLGAPTATVDHLASAGALYICWGVAGAPGQDGGFSSDDCDRHKSPGGASANEQFGTAVAILNDADQGGLWLLVGAPGRDTDTEEAGVVYGLEFTGRTVSDEWTLRSTLAAPQGDNERRFGSALSVGVYGPDDIYMSLAVSSPLADAELDDGTGNKRLFADIGMVEVFDGRSHTPSTPPNTSPFETTAGDQLLLAPPMAERREGLQFGSSLTGGRFSDVWAWDLVAGIPRGGSGEGRVSALFDVSQLARSQDPVEPTLTWAQDEGIVEIASATIDASDYRPESEDEYGTRLTNVGWSPLWSPLHRLLPVVQTGDQRQPLVVSAPGEGLDALAEVGTICLVDLSTGTPRQWCFHPGLAAAMSVQRGMRWGEAVLAGWLGPDVVGEKPGYHAFQLVGGAPSWEDGGDPVGAVGLVWLSMDDDQLVVPGRSNPLVGQSSLMLKTPEPLRFGEALASFDVTGQGIVDLVVTAPRADSGDGAVVWTKPTYSSEPNGAPGFYSWTKTEEEEQWGWLGDTLDVFLADMSGAPSVRMSLWSETNYSLLMSAPGEG